MNKTLALAAGYVVALSVGTGVAWASVTAADVQQWISTQLSAGTVAPPDSVACPSDLDAVAGASVTCAVTRGEETRGVTVTVDSVDGNGMPSLSIAPARQ